MNTARYIGNGALEVVDTELARPAPGEVQLEVAYTGICGTDLHILHGAMDARVTMPAVLGHEMAGRVASIGDGVEDWAVGDPATVMPLVSCGDCAACRSGASHICYRLVFLGIDAPGSMQSRWNVPADVLVRLPADLSLQTAALAEPTAVAVHDVRRSGLAAGEHAVVVGAGPIGLLIANVARSVGAEVVVFEPNELRRQVVDSLGLVGRRPARRGRCRLGRSLDARRRCGRRVRGLRHCGRHGDRDRVPRRTRTRSRRRHPRDASAGRPLPRLLARADDDRRARLRASRLRGGGAPARGGSDPERHADHGRRASRRGRRKRSGRWTPASR